MPGIAPRSPEEFRSATLIIDFTVSELVSDAAGSHSPFGDLEFPLAAERLDYQHATPAERPHLADGR
jgi:hypothetical protein